MTADKPYDDLDDWNDRMIAKEKDMEATRRRNVATSAPEARHNHLADCAALLDRIAALVECQREEVPPTWTAVGTAAAIRSRLIDVLDGMDGLTRTAIEDVLEDIREANACPAPNADAPCSLCGRPSGEVESGASWYLCHDCEGSPEAWVAGFTHHAPEEDPA